MFFLSTFYTFAFDEKHTRETNKRFHSIVSGKIKLDRSNYSVANIRFSTPNPALLAPIPSSKYYETISPRKLIKLRFSPQHYSQKKYGKQIIRGKYAANAKGRSESFNVDINGIKKFCNTNATTHFCIRQGETTIRYMGNTPRRHPRKLDFSDKNNYHKSQQSEKFSQQLLHQSNR